ncbi:hypothetical protein J3458_011673 [Metarhizium acridum]|uniref:Uncharacterized protein n=1 Tax=Metarhizium acridum (strain CQMa 102) TaxID=655827 RepID=E9DYS3_METAQ|nr:uncharacterized protein MAC_02771 [Metarhizium acridum CQMa 102]EFY91100.1 hypothetical protein MAC_02771 [Metarhizium acridum CQMa 102]KAG8414018.1 hypothetical protein J3458_011673 [Metarhizium acridum]
MGPRTHTIRIPDHRDDCELGVSDANDNNAVKIGAGLGVPLGVIAIGAIAALPFMRRGKRAGASTNHQELANKGGQEKAQDNLAAGPTAGTRRPRERNTPV